MLRPNKTASIFYKRLFNYRLNYTITKSILSKQRYFSEKSNQDNEKKELSDPNNTKEIKSNSEQDLISQSFDIYKKIMILKIKNNKINSKISVYRFFSFLLFLICFLMFQSSLLRHSSETLSSFDIDFEFEKAKQKKKYKFSDVIGHDEIKEEIQDVVDYMMNPQKYKELDAKPPKGILLTGSPGCGKTLFAKALADESNASFYHVNGSLFVQPIVGLGAKMIRNIFQEAEKNKPSIIFIDEIDSIKSKKNSNSTEQINQFLIELDGFNSKEGVFVIAATNNPKDLDKALTRSGRFDRVLEMGLPDLDSREKLFNHFLKGKPYEQNIDIRSLARQTFGCNGADIKNIVNNALIIATKNSSLVKEEDLHESLKSITVGKKRDLALSEDLRKLISVHEVGHTLVGVLTKGKLDVDSVTILHRNQSLGHTGLSFDDEFLKVQTKEDILASIDIAMGGQSAEEMVYGKDNVTTGASSDLIKATQEALQLEYHLGMGEGLGKFALEGIELSSSSFVKEKAHSGAKKVLDESYEKVSRLLKENRSTFDKLVEKLLEKETLYKDEIYAIVRGKKFVNDDTMSK